MLKGCLSILLFGFASIVASGQKSKAIPVLIVDGFSNHDWKQTTTIIKWILEETGSFKVDVFTVSTDSIKAAEWLPDFNKYKVVIQNTNNLDHPRWRWPSQAERALEKYVKNGGGLYILHSANNAFPQWKEYDKMIGLGWRPKTFGHALEIDPANNILRHQPGEGQSTGHGRRFNAVVDILNRHPINKGYPDQWQTAYTEVYYFMRGTAENIKILSYAYDSATTYKKWPIEWVVDYGKGRVYNSSMGHLGRGETYPLAYRCVGFQTTVIRVTEWLATRKVTYPVPGNFPTKNAISLKSESEFINRGNPQKISQ